MFTSHAIMKLGTDCSTLFLGKSFGIIGLFSFARAQELRESPARRIGISFAYHIFPFSFSLPPFVAPNFGQ